MRISDWSSDVFSSDLVGLQQQKARLVEAQFEVVARRRPVQVLAEQALALARREIGVALQLAAAERLIPVLQIGRASGRERGCKYGSLSVVAGTFKKKTTHHTYQKPKPLEKTRQ